MKSKNSYPDYAEPVPSKNMQEKASKTRPLVVLAGQQNSGKSTLFNMLTGANQHIANYPGVTVDKKSGTYRHNKIRIDVVDLPGTYSLTSFSLEERVARDFLFSSHPDVVVNVVDAANLKRSMLLTLQLLEAGFLPVIALNMIDVADRRGLIIDKDRLEDCLGIRVIPTIGRKQQGKKALKNIIGQMITGEIKSKPLCVQYEKIEPLLAFIEKKLSGYPRNNAAYPLRWLAIQILEGDEDAEKYIRNLIKDDDFLLSGIF